MVWLNIKKRVLAREGATVIAADRKLGEAKETIRLMNRDGLALNVDVSSSVSVSLSKKVIEAKRLMLGEVEVDFEGISEFYLLYQTLILEVKFN